jgi:hypothetical protein
MDSSAPVERRLLHTRQVICKGYARADGLWEVEGHLADVRNVNVFNKRREILVRPGETLHGMRLRITVDAAFRIVEAGAGIEHSPHGECGNVSSAYAALKGMTIGPGFLASVKARFKGAQGCTHMTELIGPVATTAIQTIISAREQMIGAGEAQAGPEMNLANSCYAWREGGEAFEAH